METRTTFNITPPNSNNSGAPPNSNNEDRPLKTGAELVDSLAQEFFGSSMASVTVIWPSPVSVPTDLSAFYTQEVRDALRKQRYSDAFDHMVKLATTDLTYNRFKTAALRFNVARHWVRLFKPSQQQIGGLEKQAGRVELCYLQCQYPNQEFQKSEATRELYRQRLHLIRQFAERELEKNYDEFKIVKKVSRLYEMLFSEIVRDAGLQMGMPAPARFCLVSMGSMAKKSMVRNSDIDYAILIDRSSPEVQLYFRTLAELVQMKIFDLGETAADLGLENGGTQGFRIDSVLCPTSNWGLIMTPQQMADQQALGAEELVLTSALRQARVIKGELLPYSSDDVFTTYTGLLAKQPTRILTTPERQEQALGAISEILLGFQPDRFLRYEKGRRIHLKCDLFRLLQEGVGALSDYFDCPELTTRKQIKALRKGGHLSEEGSEHLLNALRSIYRLRFQAHAHLGTECDEVLVPDGKSAGPVDALVLSPSQCAVLSGLFYRLLGFQKALRLFVEGENRAELLCNAGFGGESYAERAQILANTGQGEAALDACEEALKVDPWDPVACTVKAHLLYVTQAEQSLSIYKGLAERGVASGYAGLARFYETGHGGVQTDETKAREYYAKAAEGKNAEGEYKTGLSYLATDPEKAQLLFTRAANQGHPAAIHQLALLTVNARNAFDGFRRAAESGYLPAIYQVAQCHEIGLGTEADRNTALEQYKRAALLGHAPAQFRLGHLTEQEILCGSTDERAVKWYRKAAEQHHLEAIYRLAVCYDEGRGVAPNSSTSSKLYAQLLQAKGSAEVQRLQGHCHFRKTREKAANIDQALKLYLQAAGGGDCEAWYWAGRCYQTMGDHSKALAQFEKGAQAGELLALLALGRHQASQKQFDQAISNYKLAAEKGNAEAQYQLAESYRQGLGVPAADLQKALYWCNRAAEQWYIPAQVQQAHRMYNGGAEDDGVKAAIQLERAVSHGHEDPESLYTLGMLKRYHPLVPKDEAAEQQLFKGAFETFSRRTDDAEAQYLSGLCLESGYGVDRDLKKALAFYLKAAELHSMDAHYRLARGFEEHAWGECKFQAALDGYFTAAKQNHPLALLEVARIYDKGRLGIGADSKQAGQYYAQALKIAGELARVGNIGAQVVMGICAKEGLGGAQPDHDIAQQWLRLAAGHGDRDAQVHLGEMLAMSNKATEAAQCYCNAALQGSIEGAFRWGRCHLTNFGVQGDPKQAIRFLIRAAQAEHSEALFMLAECMEEGVGLLAPRPADAARIFRQLCANEYLRAQLHMAKSLEDGKFGADRDEAKLWTYKAAEAGHAESQMKVARQAHGLGSYTEAFQWAYKAADQGIAEAQFFVGLAYATGEGVNLTYKEAAKWFKMAKKQKYPGAKKNYNRAIGNVHKGFK